MHHRPRTGYARHTATAGNIHVRECTTRYCKYSCLHAKHEYPTETGASMVGISADAQSLDPGAFTSGLTNAALFPVCPGSRGRYTPHCHLCLLWLATGSMENLPAPTQTAPAAQWPSESDDPPSVSYQTEKLPSQAPSISRSHSNVIYVCHESFCIELT